MRAKSIMVVGTMSSAGKSVVTAGLCRMFHQDGYRVAPFKSQNMALNSYITKDGLEMGRAQVMQAEAAGIAPDIRMNPILLKPTSEAGSQVIVNGKVYDNLRAKEYYQRKQELIPEIRTAYESLAEEYDIVVLEGAGSPAEINLRDVDIVNMGMAAISDSPVIVVGDIDRGGVFASLYGTIALLRPEERRRIQGIIINKFRGDISILESGLTMLEELTGVPVLGVLPYLPLHLEEEDSLAEQLSVQTADGTGLDIAVIRLPRIANFTDFAALSGIEGVSVRYVTRRAELGTPDLLILPGTKNTLSDLRWLRESGLEAAILKLHEKGCGVVTATRGSKGATVYDGHHFYRQLPDYVIPVDTMGAGDSFATAMLVTILKKLEEESEANWEDPEIRMKILPVALKTAAAFSAKTCLIKGAFGGGVQVPDSIYDQVYKDL